jgi:hypothetical protein
LLERPNAREAALRNLRSKDGRCAVARTAASCCCVADFGRAMEFPLEAVRADESVEEDLDLRLRSRATVAGTLAAARAMASGDAAADDAAGRAGIGVEVAAWLSDMTESVGSQIVFLLTGAC